MYSNRHTSHTRRSSDLVDKYKAGKGLLEGTLQAGTSAVSDKLLDLVGLGGKSAADKGKDTRDYLAADLPPSPTKSSNLSETAEVDRKSGSAGMPRQT